MEVTWVNELVNEDGTFAPAFLPLDQTLHWVSCAPPTLAAAPVALCTAWRPPNLGPGACRALCRPTPPAARPAATPAPACAPATRLVMGRMAPPFPARPAQRVWLQQPNCIQGRYRWLCICTACLVWATSRTGARAGLPAEALDSAVHLVGTTCCPPMPCVAPHPAPCTPDTLHLFHLFFPSIQVRRGLVPAQCHQHQRLLCKRRHLVRHVQRRGAARVRRGLGAGQRDRPLPQHPTCRTAVVP